MIDPIKPFLDYQGMVVVDGGLATELEWRGHNLKDPLWSAKLLAESPLAIRRVHSDYLEAGADCVISASYQATIPGLMARGFRANEATDLILLSVQLATEARDEFWAMEDHRKHRLRPLVAAGIGPYGAYLANGAEYTGAYDLDVAGLAAWHRPRWRILADSKADLFACETCPSRPELEAYCQLLSETLHMPAWVSFTALDGRHICDGTPIAECAARLNDVPNVIAIGVNCTPPRLVPELIASIRSATEKYIIVYPNSGERYDAVNKAWHGECDPQAYSAMSLEWHKMGAVMIGGCCRTRPSHVRQIRDWVQHQ